jgi:hypothetical protein
MGQINSFISEILSHERTPVVLAVMSCTGVVATAVMTARAAPKASRIIEELKYTDEKGFGLTEPRHIPPREVIKNTWKIYAPAIGVGAITIGSIITMNRVGERNLALLTTGAALATSTLKDYQHHVLEEIGAERESRVRDKMAKRILATSDNQEEAEGLLLLASDGESVIKDSLSGRYFKSSVNELQRIENAMNRDILSQMYVSLNDVYEAIGLDPIDVGDILGFNTDNMVDFHYSSQVTSKNEAVLVLGYINAPVVAYNAL